MNRGRSGSQVYSTNCRNIAIIKVEGENDLGQTIGSGYGDQMSTLRCIDWSKSHCVG